MQERLDGRAASKVGAFGAIHGHFRVSRGLWRRNRLRNEQAFQARRQWNTYPSPPDPLSLFMMALPMWLLFEIGMLGSRLFYKPDPDDTPDTPDETTSAS